MKKKFSLLTFNDVEKLRKKSIVNKGFNIGKVYSEEDILSAQRHLSSLYKGGRVNYSFTQKIMILNDITN